RHGWRRFPPSWYAAATPTARRPMRWSPCLLRNPRSLALRLEPIAGPEDPGDQAQTQAEERQDHGEAGAQADVGDAVEAPAEATDEVHHRIEQRHGLPERRQHVDAVEAAAEEGQWRDDQQRHQLQLLEAVGPDA